jgi:hypothetical protein
VLRQGSPDGDPEGLPGTEQAAGGVLLADNAVAQRPVRDPARTRRHAIVGSSRAIAKQAA